MFRLVSLMGLMGMFSSTAMAAGYGDAGCGLGSVVFGSKKGFTQIFAATTNGTFASQTFGITSGTSNCGGLGKTVAQFIDTNKPSLKNDIAKGQGETLVSLGQIYNCENTGAFNATLKANYDSIFSSEETEVIARKVQAFASSCGA